MLHKTHGIVLHTIKYGDTSIIAHIYTEMFGRQSYIVNGVRSKKSRMHFNNFQPLTLLNLEVDHKNTRELQRIRELQIAHPAHNIQSNIVKSTIALFVGEVLYRCLHEAESNPTLFNYVKSAIQILDVADEGIVNFHLIFLVQFTRFIGIYPQNNLELDMYQPEGLSIKLHDLLKLSLNELTKVKLSHAERASLVSSLMDYYYYHLEGMGKLSSLEVLKAVFE